MPHKFLLVFFLLFIYYTADLHSNNVDVHDTVSTVLWYFSGLHIFYAVMFYVNLKDTDNQ